MRRRVLALLALAGTLATASGATGSAIPVAPGHGARVSDGRPFFQWSVPPNEESRAVYISTSPTVEAAGEFPESAIEIVNPVGYGSTSWQSSKRLRAGDYWWNVRTWDPDAHEEFFSTPSNFTVPAALRVADVRARSYAAINLLSVYVRFTSNAAETTIIAEVRRGSSRVIASKTRTVKQGYSTTGSARLEWRSLRSVTEGERLTVLVEIVSDDEQRTIRRLVRAP